MPTRRTVLAAALLAGAAAACTPEETATPEPEPNPDEDLAAAALAAESELVTFLDSVTRGRPRRLRALADCRTVHLAHRQLLVEALPDPDSVPEPTSSPAPGFVGDDRAAYLALARAEDRLGQILRRCALRAESGPFARVLAGMAAAAAQQATALRGLA